MTSLSSLSSDLLRIASAYSGKVTYSLTDLTSGGHIGHEEDEVMSAASLSKAPSWCLVASCWFAWPAGKQPRLVPGSFGGKMDAYEVPPWSTRQTPRSTSASP